MNIEREPRKLRKAYLGDGVYLAEDLERGIWVLTTENGIRATNTIYLEAEVYSALNATINGWHEADAEREMERLVSGEESR